MIVLKSPKGWTGPKIVDGKQVEGTFRSHQVPLSDPAAHPEHLKLLEDWLQELPARRNSSMSRAACNRNWPSLRRRATAAWARILTPTAALLLRDLRMPDFRDYAVDVPAPGVRGIGDTRVLGPFLRDVAKLNS